MVQYEEKTNQDVLEETVSGRLNDTNDHISHHRLLWDWPSGDLNARIASHARLIERPRDFVIVYPSDVLWFC